MTAKLLPVLALLAVTACASGAENGRNAAPAPAATASTPAAAPASTPAPTASNATPRAAAAAPAPATTAEVETFVRVCSGCHAPELVADKRLDRDGWHELVLTMIGRGASASDAEIKTIVDYLARTYPARG